ncbi:putative arachidonate 5-lipoxygenase [Aspergillus sclerotioniger CBS 115572]|uniref:Manganese lipoxygenase n=1 Tax=Aspergillus sclerotioniger CBS 115572 TaxID=1450535 RepID=A0A317X3B8_9EURO|nr:putative arachidonate 5-lipoxygenase [Aspergillus sclerotioniger CBS 115572]PWY93119.1 putative arachidonate 5-lipoxygenase [Aspergillus sclerotioniger CBS 115572]
MFLIISYATAWPMIPSQAVLNPSASLPDDHGLQYSLPMFDLQPWERVEEVRLAREGYLYGPPLLGNTSFFPTGVLGDAMVARDRAQWFRDVEYVTNNVYPESDQAAAALIKAGGIQSLSSYEVIYKGQWASTLPDGVAAGMLTNWTQDLLFSMERLSINPYVVRRLHPSNDHLPFGVDDAVARHLTAGRTLAVLHQEGRLFFANHSYQAAYPKTAGRWTAACSAYFFIHPHSGDFLPLAIKTNMGSDLIYTPLDEPNDWLFAKMAFNMNDLFHSQLYHLANTHDVAEPVHQAALRTMSARHPVRGYIDRLMYQAYAVRPIGEEFLFNEGGFYDSSFALPNWAGKKYATDAYWEHAGHFRATGFYRDLADRGLVDCSYGPPLRSFPFYDTVAPMVKAIEDFTRVFVESYYPEGSLMGEDHELQAWILEVNEAAKVIDFFPAPLLARTDLIAIMSHMAFLSGIAHHALNGATVGEALGVLPLHPSSFSQPLPDTKGSIDSLLPWLHNETEALKQASLLVRFNRPLLDGQKGNLPHMFWQSRLLAPTGSDVHLAEKKFRETMLSISDEIRARHFDEQGLSQGMPFIWRSIDPRKIPYYLCV